MKLLTDRQTDRKTRSIVGRGWPKFRCVALTFDLMNFTIQPIFHETGVACV